MCSECEYYNHFNSRSIKYTEKKTILLNLISNLEKKIEELTSVVAKPNSPLDFGSMNLEELNHELLRAIEDEDYERAARIRDELNKKK